MSQSSQNIIDTGDVKRVWQLFAHYWYIYLIALLLSGGLGYLYIQKVTPVYKSKVTVQLDANEGNQIQQQVVGGLQGRGYYSSYISAKKEMKNQKRLIKSHDLIKETLNRLDFRISYFLMGRLRTTPQYRTAPFEVQLHPEKGSSYKGPYQVHLIDQQQFRLIIDNEDNPYNKVHEFNQPIHTSRFHFTIRKNHRLSSLAQRGEVKLSEVEYKFKINSKGRLIRKYKRALDVKSEEYSDIIDITCTDIIPERASDFLDTLSQVYFEQSIQRRKQVNQQTLDFIDQQLQKVGERLNEVERALQSYKSKNFMLNLDQAQQSYFSQLLNFEQQKVQLRMQGKLINYLERYIKKNEGGFDFSPALLKAENFPYIKEYFNELRSLKQERERVLAKATQKSFKVQQLNQQIEDLKQQILNHLDNIKKSLPLNIEALNAQIKEYKKQIQKIPKAERKLIKIKRRLKVNEEIYLYLLEKKAENTIAKGSIVPNKTVVNQARNVGIVRPNQQRIMISALGVGFILALLGVFINELFFKKISSKEEVEEQSDIPVLGVIGRIPKSLEEYTITTQHPKTPIAESFRSVRTNLDYFGTELKQRTILVTSSFEKEGKSFCAANIAVMLSKAERKTLLIDLDLHRPALHKIFPPHNGKEGMTTYLVGKADQQAIFNTTDYENLDVIFAGPIPPNPSELLLSQKFRQFLQTARKQYDDVILDTPPTGPITDAVALMKHADITLYVIRAHQAGREYIQQANEIKEKHQPSNMAFILNGVKGYRSSYKYYYYS